MSDAAYRYWLVEWPEGEERWSFETAARGRTQSLRAAGHDARCRFVDETQAHRSAL